jgi:RimJ/RimL family protein N-acetyltransferase
MKEGVGRSGWASRPTTCRLLREPRDPVAVGWRFPARDRAAFDAHWAKILADETTITKTVMDGDVAGNLGSWRDEDSRRQIGYWFGRSFWGKGIATAALALFVAEMDERPLCAQWRRITRDRSARARGSAVSRSRRPVEPDAGGVRHS